MSTPTFFACFGRASLLVCASVWAVLGCHLAQGEPSSASELTQRITASGFHGGLVVLVGMQDADVALRLSEKPNIVVHGLVRDLAQLDRVRRQIRAAGLYGRVSAHLWEVNSLPYAADTVNLLAVMDDQIQVDDAEISRVLAPRGTAWIRRGGRLTSLRKPVPDDVDQWTHARYDATGNAVNKDQRVGSPEQVQWEALPRWNRGVKTSNLVTTNGRLFYILNDAHFWSKTPTWSLVARDAYSGVLLWRRELASWEGATGGKKVGPAQVNRRLVAIGDRVYAILSDGAPVSVLDAATGNVLRVLSGTEKTAEFIVSASVVVALVDAATPQEVRRGASRDVQLVAVDGETGKLLWEHADATVLPLTVASDQRQVVYHDGTSIQSLDLKTGKPRWTSPPTGQKIEHRDQANPDSPGAQKGVIVLAPQLAPTLILYDDVVAFAGGCQINVISADDGRPLWQSPYPASNYSVPVDLFGLDGHIWGPDVGMNFWRPMSDDLVFVAYDRHTGKITRRISGSYGYRFQHHRCHQMKCWGETIVAGRAGIELINTKTSSVVHHHWLRGSCYYGVLPANGLLYVPPHDCACYVRAKLSGFMALWADPLERSDREVSNDRRLQRGPAYGQTISGHSDVATDDWPTFRHDAARSGRASTKVGADLSLGWQAQIGGKLTSPVVAGNRVFVASTDRHTLYALAADTGKALWQVTFDARIDSPPTAFESLVLCGCRDGSVSALRAADGVLAWRFLAAPRERLIVCREQVESTWPVHGSVLVQDGKLYFAAGRSSYLDGGMRLYVLDPHTGEELHQTTLWTRDTKGTELLDEESVDGYLNDILSSDGQHVFMRHHVFDGEAAPKQQHIPHLHGPDGYLSSDTTSRLLWTYAPHYTSPHQGAFYDARLIRTLFPSGRILVEDGDTIYGFGQNRYDKPVTDTGGQWALFASPKSVDVPLNLSAREYLQLGRSGRQPVRFRWWKRIPIHVWAMVKTENLLFVAGPDGDGSVSSEALAGDAPGRVLAVSPADGTIVADVTVPAMPVWDGLAAARGSLYAALTNGQVLCLLDASK